MITTEIKLFFPDYSKPFDTSDLQLGAGLMQDGRPIAFFSRELTSYQRNYGVGQKEMLCIVQAERTSLLLHVSAFGKHILRFGSINTLLLFCKQIAFETEPCGDDESLVWIQSFE